MMKVTCLQGQHVWVFVSGDGHQKCAVCGSTATLQPEDFKSPPPRLPSVEEVRSFTTTDEYRAVYKYPSEHGGGQSYGPWRETMGEAQAKDMHATRSEENFGYIDRIEVRTVTSPITILSYKE